MKKSLLIAFFSLLALSSAHTLEAQSGNPVGSLDSATCSTVNGWSYDPDAPGPQPVSGCTNPAASNYNPSATQDDGSCVITQDTCTPRYRWVNVGSSGTISHDQACSSAGASAVGSFSAGICASGENRPVSGYGYQSINYARGTWGGGNGGGGTTAPFQNSAYRCYVSGQKWDRDNTDVAIAYLCDFGDSFPASCPTPPIGCWQTPSADRIYGSGRCINNGSCSVGGTGDAKCLDSDGTLEQPSGGDFCLLVDNLSDIDCNRPVYNPGDYGPGERDTKQKLLNFNFDPIPAVAKLTERFVSVWKPFYAYAASSESNTVLIYEGSTLLATVPADQYRPDVNAVMGISGNHGFSWTVPDSLKDGASHTLSVYGTNTDGTGVTTELSGSPKTIQCAPAVTPNTSPTAPTLSCPANGSYTDISLPVSFTSSDADGDAIKYRVDWDGNGTTDQTVPAGSTCSGGAQTSSCQPVNSCAALPDANACNSYPSECSWNGSVCVNRGDFSCSAYSSMSSCNPTYRCDWIPDQTCSGTETVPSGTQQTANRIWSVPGTKTVQVRTEDTEGGISAPATCTFTVVTNPSTLQCADGLDNDADGLVDMSDPGCANASDDDESNTLPPEIAQCADGLDNDVDGFVDMDDPGCTNAADDNEANNGIPQCADGIDNDGDTRVDFPTDLGCANETDNTEDSENPPCTINCDDDDGDDDGGGGDGPGDNGGPDDVISGFTVSGTEKLAIQFLSDLPATSQNGSLSINPVSGFTDPVTLSVQSVISATGTSLPPTVTATYYFSGVEGASALMTYDPSFGQYVNAAGQIGATFAVKLSRKVTEKYYITIVGQSGSRSTTHVVEIDPNSRNPEFREI